MTGEQDIRDSLQEAYDQLTHWRTIPASGDNADAIQHDTTAFEKAVRRALGAGLLDVEVIDGKRTIRPVRDWIAGKRSVGDREWFRRIKGALPSRVRGSFKQDPLGKLSADDVWLTVHAPVLIDAGKPLTFVQKALTLKLRRELATSRPSDHIPDPVPDMLGMSADERLAFHATLLERLGCKRQTFHEWLGRLNLLAREEP
ncbi:MAG TPA: hypothetical protein VGO34_11325 [Alphaproteobacteria bacterium]|jgi:hypothetical protein